LRLIRRYRWAGSGVKPPDWRSGADLWHNIQVAQARPPGCAPDRSGLAGAPDRRPCRGSGPRPGPDHHPRSI